jgi:hypothetical protein
MYILAPASARQPSADSLAEREVDANVISLYARQRIVGALPHGCYR